MCVCVCVCVYIYSINTHTNIWTQKVCIYTGSNNKIVALERTTCFHFRCHFTSSKSA